MSRVGKDHPKSLTKDLTSESFLKNLFRDRGMVREAMRLDLEKSCEVGKQEGHTRQAINHAF